jgi:hypothetical protein
VDSDRRPTDGRLNLEVIIVGHAFAQNLRRGHYELVLDAPAATRLAAAFTELVQAI